MEIAMSSISSPHFSGAYIPHIRFQPGALDGLSQEQRLQAWQLAKRAVESQLTENGELNHKPLFLPGSPKGDALELQLHQLGSSAPVVTYKPADGLNYPGSPIAPRLSVLLVDDGKGPDEKIQNAATSYQQAVSPWGSRLESTAYDQITPDFYFSQIGQIQGDYIRQATPLDFMVTEVDLTKAQVTVETASEQPPQKADVKFSLNSQPLRRLPGWL
jgi:hypothetical protein